MIFIDMDGVLADLPANVWKLNGFSSFEDRDVLFKKELPSFVKKGGFASNPPLYRAKELVEFLLTLEEPKCILTSSGHFATISDVIHQKKQNIEKYFPELTMIPFCATTSGKQKALFANKDSFLIDDHVPNVKAFIEAGGEGFVYSPEKLDELKEILLKRAGH
jgi:hypothetical protein